MEQAVVGLCVRRGGGGCMCVCMCVYTCTCVDAGESEGQSEICTALLNQVAQCCYVLCITL